MFCWILIVAIWYFEDDVRLSKTAIEAICNPENKIFVSIASVWEIGIKISTGKLDICDGVDGFINAIYKNEFFILGIAPEHVRRVVELPFFHRDPFDRILVASAITEDMPIISSDKNIHKYNLTVLC